MSFKKSRKGQFLVASPELLDLNFNERVVLIIQETGTRIVGLVLNHPSTKKIGEIWKIAFQKQPVSDGFLCLGGPIFTPLIGLHQYADIADCSVLPGLYLALDKNSLEKMLERDAGTFQVFLGSTIWTEKQLELEIKQGFWYPLPFDPQFLFQESSTFWKQMFRRVGEGMVHRVLGIPPDLENPLN